MSGLLDLAARVEALSGPDKSVDSAIVLALWPVVRIPASAMFEPRQDGWHDPKGCLPGPWNYTASLDAAMTLVPEGWHTFLVTQDRHSLRWKWHLRGGYGFNAHTRAATPALALTAAALRARDPEFQRDRRVG